MKKCELCDSQAKMYCESDQAILCWECDSRVHGANFLVAKHLRTLLCHLCQSPTPWNGSGPKLGPTVSVCNNCVNANACREERNNNEERTHDNDENDDDDDDLDDNEEDDDEEEDDDDSGGDEENQVVPLSSSSATPPVSTSSTSEEAGEGGRGSSSSKSRTCTVLSSLKRMRDNTIEPRHENPGSSFARQQQAKNNLSNEFFRSIHSDH